jgi:uncharacterized repeat protein (TIGR03806 family)
MHYLVNALRKFWTPLAFVAGASVVWAEGLPPVSIDVTSPPARVLSAYNLFRDVARQVPNAGLIPYVINTPLFSDYAEKHRFFYLPPGAQATYNSERALELPVGSVLVKTFSYFHDRRTPELGKRIVETRILMHRPEGWAGYPYVWNDDLSEARLAVAGARLDLEWIHEDGSARKILYNVPNMNQCKQCHENNESMGPIGFKARQLNRSGGEGGDNQLAAWAAAGLLAGLPEALEEVPRLPVWNASETGSLDARARAYLDVNCAHCHNPGGEAASTGLDLRWEQHEPVAYGVKKQPTAAGPASRGYIHAIQPGAPDRSFLLNRLRAADPVIMMPRTGRTLPHAEGIALIEAWIAGMDPGLESRDLSGGGR